MSFQLSGHTGPILAALKISAILLYWPTFEMFFHVFMFKTSTKLVFLHILGSELKSWLTYKWEKGKFLLWNIVLGLKLIHYRSDRRTFMFLVLDTNLWYWSFWNISKCTLPCSSHVNNQSWILNLQIHFAFFFETAAN